MALITVLAASSGACLSLARPSQPPVLTVSPREGPINAPFEVIVKGVAPGVRVKITADRVSADGEKWTSSAFFIANSQGTVNPAGEPSLDGTYRGVSPHGLYCSVLPPTADSVESFVADFHNRPTQPSSIYTPMARSPISVSASIEGREIGSVTVWRGFTIGTAGQDVSGPTGWRGQYFPPAAGVPLGEPIVVLSGSGGGIFDTTAALLASNGHPTLALATYNYQDLPKALLNRPLEQVRDGALWLAGKSGTRRAAVLGISRGSEAAQLAAAYFPDAFSGVIAEVPSHLVGGALGPGTTPADAAWSIGGNPIPPFPSQFDFAKIAEALGKAGQVEIHVFPDAGHLLVAVGRGNAVSSFSYSSSLKGYMSTGGTANGNCEASFDAFGQMLRFLNSLNAVTRPRR